jgi:hypothetical protein
MLGREDLNTTREFLMILSIITFYKAFIIILLPSLMTECVDLLSCGATYYLFPNISSLEPLSSYLSVLGS